MGAVHKSGVLRYFDRDPQQIAQLVRLRALALHGITTTIGSASNRTRQVPEFLQSWDSEPDRPLRLRGRLTVRLRRPWQVAPGEGGRR